MSNDKQTWVCNAKNCARFALRRGGYCQKHDKSPVNNVPVKKIEVATGSLRPKEPVRRATTTSKRPLCLGALCQGDVRDNYCDRHRPKLVDDKKIMPSFVSPPRKPIKKNNLLSKMDTIGALNTPPARPRRFSQMLATSDNPMDVIDTFLQALRLISQQTQPHEAASVIITETCNILKADRATLFFVDEKELVLLIAKGTNKIRLPLGKGIAGNVGQSGITINIPDAYQDSRFDPQTDKRTGYKTKSVLCTAVRDYDGEIVAVLQAINKQDSTGVFTDNDELLIEHLAHHIGITLRNAQLYESVTNSTNKVNSLLEIVRMLHSQPNYHSLVFTLNHKCTELVEADRCTLYYVDHQHQNLVTMHAHGEVDFRFPMTKGVAGHVASTGTIMNIPDAYQCPYFNQAFDKQTGFKTDSILCMPIFGGKNQKKVIAVLQVINKLPHADTQVFTAKDEDLLKTLLKVAGSIIEQCNLFQNTQKITEAGKLDEIPQKQKEETRKLSELAEDEEEEEE